VEIVKYNRTFILKTMSELRTFLHVVYRHLQIQQS